MIISAEYFVTTNTQFKGNDRDFFIALIEARDTAIRKECADRETQLLDAAKAFQELATCYRIGKRPTEKLFARLEKANAAIMGDRNTPS